MRWFDEAQRTPTSGEMAARIMEARGRIDVSRLAPSVTVPTLVAHARHDATVPFEQGRRLATLIPGARFTSLEGQNHILLADEPAWPRFFEAIDEFMAAVEHAAGRAPSAETPTVGGAAAAARLVDRELVVADPEAEPVAALVADDDRPAADDERAARHQPPTSIVPTIPGW